MKVSDHHVRSPLLNIARACQPCHNVPEEELKARAHTIQDRTNDLIDRASVALVDMINAIAVARKMGATDEQLKPALDMQRKAQFRLDFVYSENSRGFHASQETARILAESMDYSRQGERMAVMIRTPEAGKVDVQAEPVHGATPTEKAPPGPYKNPDAEIRR